MNEANKSDNIVHAPKMVKITKVIQENPTVSSIEMKAPNIARIAEPGQFVMVWCPGVDEAPMGLSIIDKEKGIIAITVEQVGEATRAVCSKKAGDFLGIRGPYGKGFALKGKKIVAVGGGYGMAPLRALIQKFLKLNIFDTIDVIIAAKTKEQLVFLKEMEKLAEKNSRIFIQPCTDDGTRGMKGLAHQALLKIVSEKKVDEVYAVGPELMLKKVFEITEKHGIELQVSLTRYVKCAIGLCGQCVLDPTGTILCTEGPVFNSNKLREIKKCFGKYTRDASGQKITF
ncbi:MAG: dihydroorotate dehydrogenase electron transfer subunit [Candidatus Wukongarchaeota archaeon]|nr:dihydroorotate dehydrogenase electron transfer subunit [Candidatus Wukongarchaeota archaeon]